MTVQLKVTEIRKLIKEQIANMPEDALISLNKKVQIDLDENGKSGEITLKFKANAAPKAESKKPSVSSKKPKANDTDGLKFAKGEKAKLEKKFKSALKKVESKNIQSSDFGQTIELKSGVHLIVGIDVERSKYVVRRFADKTRFASPGVARKQLDTPEDTKPKAGKTPKASSAKQDKQITEFTIVSKKTRPAEDKMSKEEKRKAKHAFHKQANKLVKEGVDSDWFYKVLKVKGKSFRMIALDAKTKTVKLVDISNGKQSKLKLSKLLPF